MAQSFLSQATADRIDALRQRALATQMQIGMSEDVTLWRDTDDGAGMAIGPTPVLIEMANRRDVQTNGAAALLSEMDGTMTAVAPWNVKKYDRFTLSSGLSGQIRVVPPAVHGIQTATFVLEE